MCDIPVTPAAGTDKKRGASSPLDQLELKKTKTLLISEELDCSINMAEHESNTDTADHTSPTIRIGDDQMIEIAKLLKGTFQSQLEDMISKIVSGVVGGLQAQIVDLQKENTTLKDTVSNLEKRVELLETMEDRTSQYSRRNCLRISGIVESEGENTDDVVLKLVNDMKVNIKLDEIDRTHRLGKKPESFNNASARPRDIIIKFATYRSRQKMYKRRTSLRDHGKYKRTYINEVLTKKRGELFYNARLLIKNKAVKNAWTSDGSIFIEKHNEHIHRIETLSEFVKFKSTL